MPLFLFPAKNNVKVANDMKQTKTIWSSIGLLTGVVIANLALVRGPWQLPLLIGTFAVWGLWLLWTQVLPFHRTLQAQRRQERAESFNRSLAQLLLRHVNYRVSDCLKAVYPDARWEWMMRDPALFVAQGGTGRIRVFGIKDYEYADVTVDQSGKLSCSLVKMVSVQETKEPAAPNQEKPDHEAWYEAQGRDALGKLVADLDSRGHNALTVQEDGSICICPKADGKEVKQGVLSGLPAKALWPELVKLLEQDGLAAAVQNDCIAVTW